jgi:hypothetical protein
MLIFLNVLNPLMVKVFFTIKQLRKLSWNFCSITQMRLGGNK